MTATSVAEALALIPRHKAKLDTEDNLLRQTIHHVEHVLNELQPGVTTTLVYRPGDGKPERRLEFMPANRRWIIVWVGEEADVPLLNTSRDVRAEVFSPLVDGLSPIELLIIEVAENLETAGSTRSPMLEVARRLSSVLTASGFPPPR